MKFSDLPEQARALWAKSGDPIGHGLLAHMLDVAAVTEVILDHEPQSSLSFFATQFSLPQPSFTRHIAALVGLHDFGKAIAGFQSKWQPGQALDGAAGLKFSASDRGYADHASASAALLRDHLCRMGAPPGWVLAVLQAISAHHGYNLSSTAIQAATSPFESPAWSHARQTLFDNYWQALSPEGIPSAEELPLAAVEWLAGLTSVADWIGSNVEWFPLGERAESLPAHFAQARLLASHALHQIGWSSSRNLLSGAASCDELIRRITQRPDLNARPLQVEGDCLLRQAQGPVLLLVEAPMGEGKTELAFLAHLRLQGLNQHRGLYVALPTQATGNALFDRTLTFLRAFNHRQPLDIQLVHGGAMLDERVQRLRGICGAPGDDIVSSAWFSQRRRPLLSPYGVGTVDQALLAVLNVKHHFVRLWGLANRVVVLDEVHAYDTYTSGLIESLLRWLKALGSSVVLMSATLPEQRRHSLLRAWDVPDNQIPALPYPRLVMADNHGVRSATFASRPLPPISLQPVEESLPSLAACALQQLKAGGYGALIVNTVDRAQKLYRLLFSQLDTDVQLILFHARFPGDERSELEKQVLQAFGRRQSPGHRPGRALLIATQVAEQSLDIDFDFMITDLAPVDLVLQRAGRLHRHQRMRPAAHTEARLFVAGLSPHCLPDLKGTAWEFVYQPYILGRTWALLSREQTVCLPHDIDRLVQAVYGDTPLPPDLDPAALQYITVDAYGKHLAHQRDERQKAVNIAINPMDEPQHAYLQKPPGNEEAEGTGLTNRTRLGDDAITVVPVHDVEGRWCIHPGGDTFDPEQVVPDALARQLHARQLKLNRKALLAHFAQIEAPAAFASHPLLQHMKPLVLDRTGSCAIDKWLLHLDSLVGLTYASCTVADTAKEYT